MHKSLIVRRLIQEDESAISSAEHLFIETRAWGNLPIGVLKNFVNAPTCAVYGAFSDKELIGASVVGLMPENQFKNYKDYGSSVQSILVKDKIAVLIATVLKENFRGQGIGKKLQEVRLDWAQEVGAAFAITLSWINQTQYNSARLLNAAGFREITRFCNTAVANLECLVCRSKNCHCEQVIYLKKL